MKLVRSKWMLFAFLGMLAAVCAVANWTLFQPLNATTLFICEVEGRCGGCDGDLVCASPLIFENGCCKGGPVVCVTACIPFPPPCVPCTIDPIQRPGL